MDPFDTGSAVTLIGLLDPMLSERGFPTGLLIEHPGRAATQARASEDAWAEGTPYDDVVASLQCDGAANPAGVSS